MFTGLIHSIGTIKKNNLGVVVEDPLVKPGFEG